MPHEDQLADPIRSSIRSSVAVTLEPVASGFDAPVAAMGAPGIDGSRPGALRARQHDGGAVRRDGSGAATEGALTRVATLRVSDHRMRTDSP